MSQPFFWLAFAAAILLAQPIQAQFVPSFAPHEITSLLFVNEDKQVWSVCSDARLRRWDLATAKVIGGVVLPPYSRLAIVSPDHARIAAVGSPDTISLLDTASGRQLGVLKRSTSKVLAIAFSPDGGWLAAGSEDGAVRVWDTKVPSPQHVLQIHQGLVAAVAFSPNGKLLISGGWDGTLQRWDFLHGKHVGAFVGPRQRVTHLRFSPQGDRLYSAGWGRELHVWDVDQASHLHRITLHEVPSAVALSADGKTLFVGSSGEELNGRAARFPGRGFLWDLEHRSLFRELPGHASRITAAHFGSSGKLLATAADDREIRIWDVASGQTIHTFQERRSGLAARGPLEGVRHPGAIVKTAVSRDGTRLATAGDDGTVRLWELPSLKERQVLRNQPRAVSVLKFSPDGTLIAVAETGETIRLWNLQTEKLVREFPHPEGALPLLEFSPDGKEVFISDADKVSVLSIETGQRLRDHATPHIATLQGVSQDGTRAVSLTIDTDQSPGRLLEWRIDTGERLAEFAVQGDADHYLMDHDLLVASAMPAGSKWPVYDLTSHQVLCQLPPRDRPIQSIAVSPDRRYLAACDVEGHQHLYELAKGDILGTQFPQDRRSVVGCTFTPDSRGMVTVVRPGSLELKQVTEVLRSSAFAGHNGLVTAIATTPDNAWMATGDHDSRIIVWDAASGRQTVSWRTSTRSTTIRSLEFSRDARWLLSVTSPEQRTKEANIQLWDRATGHPIATLRDKLPQLPSVGFAPDNNSVWMATGAPEVSQWPLAQEAKVRSFVAHTMGCGTVAAAADGKIIATGGSDHLVKLWDANTLAPLATWESHADAVSQLAFSADSRWLVSADASHHVKVWDVAKGSVVASQDQLTNATSQLAFSPSDTLVAVLLPRIGSILVWNFQSDIVRHLKSAVSAPYLHPTCFAFRHDGTLAVAGSSPPRFLGTTPSSRDWVTYGRRPEPPPHNDAQIAEWKGHDRSIDWLSFTPDGRYLATRDVDRVVKIWDLQNQQLRHTFSADEGRFAAIAMSPDGKFLATSISRPAKTQPPPLEVGQTPPEPPPPAAAVQLWDVATGQSSTFPEEVPGEIRGLAFSPDGNRLITGTHWVLEQAGADLGRVHLWDASHQQQESVVIELDTGVQWLSFSPTGKHLVLITSEAGSRHKNVSVWDTSTWKRQSEHGVLASSFPWPHGHPVFSKDGRYLAFPTVEMVDGRPTAPRLKALDLDGNQEILEQVTGTANCPVGAAFTHDGQYLAIDNGDDRVRVWTIPGGSMARTLPASRSHLQSLLLSPNGRVLVQAGAFVLTLWDTGNWSTARLRLMCTALAFSADSRWIALGQGEKITILSVERALAQAAK